MFAKFSHQFERQLLQFNCNTKDFWDSGKPRRPTNSLWDTHSVPITCYWNSWVPLNLTFKATQGKIRWCAWAPHIYILSATITYFNVPFLRGSENRDRFPVELPEIFVHIEYFILILWSILWQYQRKSMWFQITEICTFYISVTFRLGKFHFVLITIINIV